jgi:hypothetical protein
VSETVTILAIVTPAAVTVLGLWFGASREDRRIHAQSRAEAGKEIGDVLDDGAQALTEGLIAFERRRAKGSDPDETGNAFAERLREAQRIDQRVTIRLGGEDRTATSYRTAVEKLDEMSRFAYKAHGEELDKEASGELIGALKDARRAFLRSAYEYRLANM